MGSGQQALEALDTARPRFHPDPTAVGGALENQFTQGPRELEGAGGASYAISRAVLEYLTELPGSGRTSVETGCGYTTVVLAATFATHVCVNPDLSSNRLVREFVSQHVGSTALRHVDQSSDLGLPELVGEGLKVDLGLIDGNHSHPFPLLDFHYIDKMLAPGGRLLVDNTEIEAVQELTAYLDVEPAYEMERVIGNCAVYSKVAERALGWRGQALRRAPEGADIARRELARLRMEITPELRAALAGGAPHAGSGPGVGGVPSLVDERGGPGGSSTGGRAASGARGLRDLVKWYQSPSGLLAAAALLLLAVGLGVSGWWTLIGVAGVALFAAFLPYKFLREQRRNDAAARSIAGSGAGRSRAG